MKYIFFVLSFIFGIMHASAQGLYKCNADKSVWQVRKGAIDYAITLPAATTATATPDQVTTHGFSVVCIMVDKRAYLPEDESPYTNESLMTQYAVSEAQTVGIDNMKSEQEVLANGETIIFWYGTLENATDEMNFLHAAKIIDNTIVWLAAPQRPGKDFNQLKKLLVEAVTSIEMLAKGAPPCGELK